MAKRPLSGATTPSEGNEHRAAALASGKTGSEQGAADDFHRELTPTAADLTPPISPPKTRPKLNSKPRHVPFSKPIEHLEWCLPVLPPRFDRRWKPHGTA